MSFRILQKIGFTLLPIASFVGGYYFLYPQFASLPDDNHDFAAVTPVLPRVDSYKRFKNTASRVLAADQVVNLATVPLQKLDWENVVTVAGGIKYKNGDVVIHENNTLHLAPQSVHTNDIASGAVTSRTIKNHSIGGQDIDIGAAITVGTLTVSGDATFSGNQSIQGTLDINSLFHIGTNGDITKIKGLTYTWPTVHTTSGVLQNDGTGGLIWQTLGAASVTPDSLDFTEFKDTLTLDASTDIALGALTFSTSGTGSVAFNNTGLFTVAGNVGIGDTSPASLLTVGSGDLFQVNSSGAIAAATGVTSSGTITLSGIASDGAEATAILINGSNQLVYRELGSNAFTSTGYANTALSNLASVAINTSLISDTDSTDDLGSTTVAWANLYVDTIKSITGNALNITPVAGQNLNVNLSTTGDFAVNTNQLYVDTSAGNVGIGTTGPTNQLHIYGATARLNLQASTVDQGAYTRYIQKNSGGTDTEWVVGTDVGIVGELFEIQLAGVGSKLVINQAGNVGIGDTSPASLLTVGSGDLFQVNSSGAIASAAGVTSSGTITFSGVASDGAEATAILINGSNQLVYRELGSNAFTSTGYANTALSNLASVAINTSLISDTDSTDDLGSTTVAWANLYVDTIKSITGNALNITPVAGQNLNVNLSTTGDFAVNTNQLYVDTSAGNVGIGTIIPTKKLHVSGTGQTAIGVFNTDTANRAQLSAQNDGNSYGAIDAYGTAQSGNLFGSLQLNNSVLFKGSATDANAFVAFGSVSNNPVVLGTNNAERVRIDTSGNVGIGTTSPSSKLDVTTAGLGTTQTATSGLALVNTTAATAGAQQISPALRWSGFGWKTDATAASQAVDFRSYVVPVQGAANPTGYLSFGSSINGAAYNDGQMVLTSGGNVGIGTTGPAEKLEVLGTGSGIQIDATSNHIIFADGSRNVKWYEYVTSNDLRFWDTTERVTFKSGGNVGIGTTTPGYLLDVFGTARIGANTGVSTVLFGSAAPTANGTGQLNFQNSDSYPSWQIMAGGTSLGNLQFTPSTVSGGSTYTTPVMSITNSGNVGIGTTGPAGKLDVSSGEAGVTAGDLVVDTANKTVYVGRQSSTTGDNSKFVVRFRTGSAAVTLDPNSATGVIQVVPQSSVYKGLVATGTSGQTANLVDINSYGNTNGNLFVINSGGSVGIGDTTPASLLTVGSGDLFQVNSSGAIAAATGVTSSGTITLSGIASDGAEATAILINGSNQLVYRELGSNAFTSTGYANTALSNLASVAINTSLLPGTDNSIDLGSNTYRWRDLYLGSTTLHIGTSTTDEGTIAYDTTGNILNVSTDSTTNGDIAFFTDDLYLDKSTGNVGIGTTVPSKTLDVRGDANFGATSGTTYIGSNVNSNVRVRFTTNDIALTGNPYVYLGDPSNNWSLIAYPTGSSLGGAGIFIRSTADDQGALIVKARNSTQSADILSVQNSAGAVLTNVTASGLVGIGTTSPSSKLDVTTAGLGTTQTTTSGLALVNTTAAGAGAQQISPALRWSGYGWKTDATAASQAVDFRSYVVPVQGTANPTGYLSFGSSINGAAYNDGQMVLTSGGNVGIGTTVPAAKLDIQTTAGGDFNAINFHATAGQTSIITADNGPLAFNSNGPYRVLTLDASQNGTFSNNLAITKVLQVNGTGNSYIQGNVGIGTTSPTTLFEIGSSDLGDGAAGPIITLGRNTNATNTGAGSMNFMSKAGTAGYVWQDNAGQMRINTAAPTNANDTAGTVIGTQSSSLASKNLAGEFTDYTSALNIIVDAPLYNFTYKSGAYNNQEFTGIITDYSPTFGMDKDAEHPAGKSLNVVTAIGYTFGAIKQLDRSFASVNLKTDQNITTLSALQVSVDAQLTVIGGTLNQLTTNDQLQTTKNNEQDTALETLTSDYQSLTANFANLQSDINAQVSKTALIETQMATLTEQLATLTDFYTTFDLGNLITKDTLGNVDLLGGKLKAKILETGALTIEVVDPDAPTIGSAEILPVATDADSDGNDDYTNKPMTDPDVAARDGKSLVVKTKSVSEKTRVFVTLKNLLDVPLVVTKIEEGENFKVEVKTAVSEKVKFDWLIVEEK